MSRWKSHALACSRVMRVSYDTFTSRTELDEAVEGPAFGGTDVGGRDDPQRGRRVTRRVPATDQFGQLLLEDPQPVPLHERAQEIDPIGRGQLALHL